MAKETRGGSIVGVNGNLVTVAFDSNVRQNEVGYVLSGDVRLMAEVIRVRDQNTDLQVFEETHGLVVGGRIEFSGELLSIELGPGLLGMIVDGLQNPLPELAEQCGFFLQRGTYLKALSRDKKWTFTPGVEQGASVIAGDALGTVPEGIFKHRILIPFGLAGAWKVVSLAAPGDYTVDQEIAVLESGRERRSVTMIQRWPVKRPIACYEERLAPTEQLITKQRLLDTLLPVAKGGTYCIPGPFGAGKTVLQQITSRHAEADVVIIAACGERAGEVVETLREFPELTDPRTGRSLMERTIIVCNTSSMPVAARESSVYTAVTMAEYYRQMGLDTLLLADSTSRWAQALREMSGRLEEIPGEEAFPAYLESVTAAFYERAGNVRLNDGGNGSVTIGGTVSPAGGSFEEPVTQATLKVVGAFHGLSQERADARRYPAIHPLESWSKYSSVIDTEDVELMRRVLHEGHEVGQMMKVVEEAGTAISDFIMYLKSEYFDAAYLQQDAFHEVDWATSAERQRHVCEFITELLRGKLTFKDKADARHFFQTMTQATKDWNRVAMEDDKFAEIEKRLRRMLTEASRNAESLS